MKLIFSITFLKVCLFLLALTPLALLLFQLTSGQYSGDIIEKMTETTGKWSLKFLILTLSITPIRQLIKRPQLIKFRRMLGLFAFFYAACHLMIFIIFDHYFDWTAIIQDVVEKKYIFMGMLSFLLMLPLAITSTNAMIKRLGGKNWQRLHRLIYLIAIFVMVHFFWQIKADFSEAIIYGFIVFVLLAYRLKTLKN